MKTTIILQNKKTNRVEEFQPEKNGKVEIPIGTYETNGELLIANLDVQGTSLNLPQVKH